jgi:hypothetical protein
MGSTGSFENEKDMDLKVEDAGVALVKPDREFTLQEEDAMHRRMDWRIMPILALLYRKLRPAREQVLALLLGLFFRFFFSKLALIIKLTINLRIKS